MLTRRIASYEGQQVSSSRRFAGDTENSVNQWIHIASTWVRLGTEAHKMIHQVRDCSHFSSRQTQCDCFPKMIRRWVSSRFQRLHSHVDKSFALFCSRRLELVGREKDPINFLFTSCETMSLCHTRVSTWNGSFVFLIQISSPNDAINILLRLKIFQQCSFGM